MGTAKWDTWKAYIEEVGREGSPESWEKYGIPKGTPKKRAVILRLFNAIIEDKAYHLLPKIFEYTEPPTKQIDINVTDWRGQLDQMGVPIEIVTERLRELLTDVVRERFIDGEIANEQRGLVEINPSAPRPEESRSTQLDSSGRPPDEDSDAGSSRGQETGSATLDSNAETETPS